MKSNTYMQCILNRRKSNFGTLLSAPRIQDSSSPQEIAPRPYHKSGFSTWESTVTASNMGTSVLILSNPD